ncbi:hypothetical protein [uncultured Gimesia sp.]|uniref:hypothetical protein n=1 Tax=uncultured Gimesia sp. TaxID=1678688 RepID=UPI0026340A98|nr:hypothetical protein [uncultured Gimesia sp.]
MMKTEDLEKLVINLLEPCRSLLDPELLTEVDHYLEHGEPEMAFEGLLIELTKSNLDPTPYNTKQWEHTAKACGLLSEGGIFDYEIWSKFCSWRDISK